MSGDKKNGGFTVSFTFRKHHLLILTHLIAVAYGALIHAAFLRAI